MFMENKKAILLLEDGSVYKGWSFSKTGTTSGEIVFNTGMTGYQEILSDPSYKNQVINFCYPEFGNTGINREDNESGDLPVAGMILKQVSIYPSSWREQSSVIDFYNQNNIIGLYGIDTRKLTKHLRDKGAMNCIISNESHDIVTLMDKLKKVPTMKGLNLVDAVTHRKRDDYSKSTLEWYRWDKNFYNKHSIGANLSLAVIDFGCKSSIVNCLEKYGCKTCVVSHQISFDDLMSYEPDGIVLSNGPGDPAAVTSSLPLIKSLISKSIPIFGICMGHQLLSLALGHTTFKLEFGHRGLNHPCGINQKVEITSQNHGFAVEATDTQGIAISKTEHLNLNDNTIAGLSHQTLPIFSVQYHPEAGPGPKDAEYLFENFIEIVRNNKINLLSKN
uniref:carbamoyl-phosphate synthase arginine-specific small subunit n=1 Tax=Timspurckia oligopyrenoides TaxID=708627 RepID=UPI001FCD9412|nr:carbamoyl-phosphate synthase arginine-specific small subunit [Timspurckia oligopyrenoides]UNJ17437.1 carbamoyl-phosphate synthase arginine-specific small subunit [Timspurckia oligopyrenoides]